SAVFEMPIVTAARARSAHAQGSRSGIEQRVQLRVAANAAANFSARRVRSAQSPALIDAEFARSPPAPTATAPAANHSARLSGLTPPVGMRGASGKGPRRAPR